MITLATHFGKFTQLRQNRPLTDDEIRMTAPSIFAADKHASRSDRYTYIPSGDLLTALKGEGFQPFMVAQSRTRISERREHTKHMVRLRHEGQINADHANEIVLINSHDGTSAYQMLAGAFRFVCANGLVQGDQVADIRVPHKGNVLDRVAEGAHSVLAQFASMNENITGMKHCYLSEGAQQAFAAAALELRYDADEYRPFNADKLLQPHRSADSGNDLWSTFNRVQENLLRGGVRGRSAKGKITNSRAITGIDQSVKLNRALWTLAEELKKRVA